MRDLNNFSGLLSDLTINTDKDWDGKRINNVGTLRVAYMKPDVDTIGQTLLIQAHNGTSLITLLNIKNATPAVLAISNAELATHLNANSKNIIAINEITFAKIMSAVDMNSQTLTNLWIGLGSKLLENFNCNSKNLTAINEITFAKLMGHVDCNSKNLTAINEITFAKLMGHVDCNNFDLENQQMVGGTVKVYEEDDVETSTSTSYEGKATVAIRFQGSITIKFSLKTSHGDGTAYGRIYIDGSPVGTEQSTSSTSYVEYTQTLGGITNKDVITIYLKTSNVSYTTSSTLFGLFARGLPSIAAY